MRARSMEVDPIYISVPPGVKGYKQDLINVKMIGLDHKFECGPTAREILTTISDIVCGECLVDPVCKVVCSNYFDSYRWMVEWLNKNENRQVNEIEILDTLKEIMEDLE